MPSRGQKDLNQYIFSRPEMARLLGISTNALRMRMKKGKCDLDYRFDGKKFLFKRPSAIKVHRPPLDSPKTSHEKSLREYDRKVQKRVNRGATHENHGGEPIRKGKYTQQSFKYHNEMKILNSLQGKYQNDAQKREFEAMNEEALKEADKRAKTKAEKSLGDYNNRPKYGGMVYGSSAKQWDRPYDVDRRPRPDSSFHITGKAFCGYGNSEQMPEEKEEVIYTWNEPKIKDPGADYKPGRFKHLDEAIRNTKNGKR